MLLNETLLFGTEALNVVMLPDVIEQGPRLTPALVGSPLVGSKESNQTMPTAVSSHKDMTKTIPVSMDFPIWVKPPCKSLVSPKETLAAVQKASLMELYEVRPETVE